MLIIVLFVKFIFILSGVHYLGRLLAGLDPHKKSFADLPPHFDVSIENEDMNEFMILCYGPIIHKYKDEFYVSSCLLFFAANIAYHQDMSQEVIARHPHNFFVHLLIFTDIELLTRVTDHVTYQTTKVVMKR